MINYIGVESVADCVSVTTLLLWGSNLESEVYSMPAIMPTFDLGGQVKYTTRGSSKHYLLPLF